MQIKYPENLDQKTCARIAHRCFGRDLLTENKEGFAVRSNTKSRKFDRYTLSLDTLEKHGLETFVRRAYPDVKAMLKEIRSKSRSRLDGHIKTKSGAYNPATGNKPSIYIGLNEGVTNGKKEAQQERTTVGESTEERTV